MSADESGTDMEYEEGSRKRLRTSTKTKKSNVTSEGMTFEQLLELVKSMRTEQKVMWKRFDKAEQDLVKANRKIANLETELKSLKLVADKPAITQTNTFAPYAQILRKNIANLTNEEKVVYSEQVKEANEMYDEASERERRKKNVVIFGLPESKKEKVEEKRKDDENSVREILTNLEVTDVKVNKIIRYKKKSEKMIAPLVVIEFENEKQRNAVLYASKKLRNFPTCKNLYLNADLTALQRKGFNLLKKQRDEQNKNETDKNIRHAIRGGKVVQFKVSPTQSQ
jgi:hypothetical protein